MDLFQLITEIEKVDPEVYQRFDTRRRAFKHLGGLGQKLTAAALPAFFATMFNKAYGQGSGTTLPSEVAAVLNLALQLEYLEYHFYDEGLRRNVVPGTETAAITTIRNDEAGHIKVLRGALGAQAISQTDIPITAFDYTSGGSFSTVFSDPAIYFGVAQSFVDTGVRAYKGGAPILMLASNRAILQAGLDIHSVEARHSSHIRTVRRGLSAGAVGTTVAGDPLLPMNARPKSWVSLRENDGPAPPKTAPVYGAGTAPVAVPAQGSVPAASIPTPAEDNVTHAQFNAQTGSTAPTGLTITAAAASEAFDEPLNDAAVKAIARNFRANTPEGLALFN